MPRVNKPIPAIGAKRFNKPLRLLCRRGIGGLCACCRSCLFQSFELLLCFWKREIVALPSNSNRLPISSYCRRDIATCLLCLTDQIVAIMIVPIPANSLLERLTRTLSLALRELHTTNLVPDVWFAPVRRNSIQCHSGFCILLLSQEEAGIARMPRCPFPFKNQVARRLKPIRRSGHSVRRAAPRFVRSRVYHTTRQLLASQCLATCELHSPSALVQRAAAPHIRA